MRTVLRILNEEIRLDCAPDDQRRLEDLADALERRLAGFSGDEQGYRRLVLTSLALLDEAQCANAALARARCEIDRLNDMLAETAPAPLDARVNVLRA
jgi:cell division protein ZapA (FtsZ GTPase activity inhibitor)